MILKSRFFRPLISKPVISILLTYVFITTVGPDNLKLEQVDTNSRLSHGPRDQSITAKLDPNSKLDHHPSSPPCGTYPVATLSGLPLPLPHACSAAAAAQFVA